MQSFLPDPAPSKINWLTIAQLIFSGLGVVFSLLFAAGLGFFGLTSLAEPYIDQTAVVSIFSVAWICLFIGLLAVPSLVFSLQRLLGRPARMTAPNQFRQANLLILLWPVILLLGNFISTVETVKWLFLPPLQLLAIGLPIWWLVSFVSHGLPAASQQRKWGLFTFSAFITMPLIMLIEIAVMAALAGIGIFWLNSQPELLHALEQSAQQFLNAQADPEQVLTLLTPYLQNPLVISSVLALIAGIIPLIEELLKPLGVWLLAGRNLSQAEGFFAGAVCGASFALIESLFYLSNPTDGAWALLAIGRAGTGLLHTASAAMFGWAMAAAWQKGRYFRLVLVYILAAACHGLWNGLSILLGLSAAINQFHTSLQVFQTISQIAPFGIGALVVFYVLFLFEANRILSRRSASAAEKAESISM